MRAAFFVVLSLSACHELSGLTDLVIENAQAGGGGVGAEGGGGAQGGEGGGDSCETCTAGQICKAGDCKLPRSCAELHAFDATAVDGAYDLDPDGDGGDPLSLYCDMTTDGGGWTLIHKTDQSSADDRTDGGFDVAALSTPALDAVAVLPRETIVSLGDVFRIESASDKRVYWTGVPYYTTDVHADSGARSRGPFERAASPRHTGTESGRPVCRRSIAARRRPARVTRIAADPRAALSTARDWPTSVAGAVRKRPRHHRRTVRHRRVVDRARPRAPASSARRAHQPGVAAARRTPRHAAHPTRGGARGRPLPESLRPSVQGPGRPADAALPLVDAPAGSAHRGHGRGRHGAGRARGGLQFD